MQYHLDGFRPGDPDLHPAVPQQAGEPDVLIIGCGPAGLTLAAQLARFPAIRTRIVDARPGRMERGQADGISVRSMEMFRAMGIADRIAREAYQVNEVTFWTPDPNAPGHIRRTGRVQDVEDGLSDQPHVILNQARVHDRLLEMMEQAPTRLRPDYRTSFAGYAAEGAALEVTLHGPDGPEVVRPRYLVGCDGARSDVRRAMGLTLDGASAHQVWGVMDVLCVTDFPDIRFKSLIQSAAGNILLIPREGGYLVRIYVELDELAEGKRLNRDEVTAERLIAASRAIFAPYAFEVKELVWWSVYEIGQRLTRRFDDGAAAPRVFIAGDACHTHSPKAGQGMNVSMGDAFNLGWKLQHVLTGRAAPELLASYSAERQAVAQALIDFDEEWARIMSAPPEERAETPEFQRYFVEHGRYTAGVSVRYAPSALTGEDAHQDLAAGLPLGMRFHSAPAIRICDGKALELGAVQRADARWLLLAFAPGGAVADQVADLTTLCDALGPIIDGITPSGADPDAIIDLRAVLQCHPHAVGVPDMPPRLRPQKGRYGLTDSEKAFCADPRADIFDLRGIDRTEGCLVLVRPDQYVAQVLPFDGTARLAEVLSGIFRKV